MTTTVRGTILQVPEPGELAVAEDHVITVGDDGLIVSIEPAERGHAVDVSVPDHQVILPGLIDAHLHAPQWPQRGTGLDLPLEQWLVEHTFPLEAGFADEALARSTWEAMVPALLRRGTTTAVYHASIHEAATVALAETCARAGQRALIGRVAMDHPQHTPDWYRDTDASRAVEASARSVEAIRALGSGLVAPVITPRFIPACTDATLAGLAELAEATGALVQTHCSESDWQHAHAQERYGCSDATALDRLGLLRDHTVLAHATHLTDADRGLVADRGAGVAHCPLSNSYFANAVFPARAALRANVRVGLGSDIAGGSEASMLAQCVHAVTASRMLEDGVDVRLDERGRADSRIDVTTAFWMATLGGAELLGIPAGLLEVGRVFDAIAIDIGPGSGVEVHAALDGWDRVFEKIVRTSMPSDIATVWVNGDDVTPPDARGPRSGTMGP